jgi:hypothetical protein
MKNSISLPNLVILLATTAIAMGAAPFQNLNFEATTLPSNGPPSFQPIMVALPGWRAFIGANEETRVLYNELTLGAAFVGLSGTSFPVLQDSFSVALVPGAGSELGGVTLFQSGHIPDDAQSLRFLAIVGGELQRPLSDRVGVFIDEQQVSLTDAFSEPGLYNYSADISAFAGRDVTLSFTSSHLGPLGPNSLILDSISFSTTPVPEPSTFALFAITGAFGWVYWRRKTR